MMIANAAQYRTKTRRPAGSRNTARQHADGQTEVDTAEASKLRLIRCYVRLAFNVFVASRGFAGTPEPARE